MIVVIFRKSIEHFDLIYLVMEFDCILIFVLMREQLWFDSTQFQLPFYLFWTILYMTLWLLSSLLPQ